MRNSPRLVCLVTTPITVGPASAPRRSLTIGTARTLVGVSSNQSGDDESTISADSKAPWTCVRHCGRTPLTDDVTVEQRRCPARPCMSDRDEGTVLRLNPDDDVRRREIGEELPVTGESVQPLDVAVGQETLGMGEITEG